MDGNTLCVHEYPSKLSRESGTTHPLSTSTEIKATTRMTTREGRGREKTAWQWPWQWHTETSCRSGVALLPPGVVPTVLCLNLRHRGMVCIEGQATNPGSPRAPPPTPRHGVAVPTLQRTKQ